MEESIECCSDGPALSHCSIPRRCFRWKSHQKDSNDDVVAYCKRLHEHEKALFEERLQKEQRSQLRAIQKAIKDQEKKTRLAISSVHQQNLEKARLARNSMQHNLGQHTSSSQDDLLTASLPQATSAHPPLNAGRECVIMASLMSNSGMMPSSASMLGRLSGYNAAPEVLLNTIHLQQKQASLQSGPNISTISKELQLLSETSQAKIATLPTDLASSSSLTSRLYTRLSPFDNVKPPSTTATESLTSNSSHFEELTAEYSSVPLTRESSEISKADQDAVDALAALAGKRPASTLVTDGSTFDRHDNKDVSSAKPSFLEKIRRAEVPAVEKNKKSKKKIKGKFRPPSKESQASMRLSDDAVLRKAAWLTNGLLANSTAAHVSVEGCIPPQAQNMQSQMFAQSNFPWSVAERPCQPSLQPSPQLPALFQPSRPVKSSLSASTIERLTLQINNQHMLTAYSAYPLNTTICPPAMSADQCELRTNGIQQMKMLAAADEHQRRIAVAELIARRQEIAANSLSHHLAIPGGATAVRGVGSVPESGLATVSMTNATNVPTARSRDKNDNAEAALEFAARFSNEFQQYKKLRQS